MIRLFMAQNNPAKKKVNNSKIYYYGPEYYGSSSQIFLLEFDYPIANTNIDDLYVDQNVQYEVTDNTGYVHTGTARIASSYFENYDIPAYNHQYIPFTITFDDGVYFEDVEDINIINWTMTTHVDQTYIYPEPSYSTGNGPWTRLMCVAKSEISPEAGNGYWTCVDLQINHDGDEYAEGFMLLHDMREGVFNTPVFVNTRHWGVPCTTTIMNSGGTDDYTLYHVRLYRKNYQNGAWTSTLYKHVQMHFAEAWEYPYDLNLSELVPTSNIVNIELIISEE